MTLANTLAAVREGVKMVLFGGNDADRAADLLKRKGIPVVITPVLRLPSRADDGFDTPFTLADKRAVTWFQKKQGWTGSDADGYPGPETWKRLKVASPK